MANIKSAAKRAKQSVVRRERNYARKSSMKTAIKKLMTAIENGEEAAVTISLFREAEAKIARAKGKGLLHSGSASRKISRLAKKVALGQKAA